MPTPAPINQISSETGLYCERHCSGRQKDKLQTHLQITCLTRTCLWNVCTTLRTQPRHSRANDASRDQQRRRGRSQHKGRHHAPGAAVSGSSF